VLRAEGTVRQFSLAGKSIALETDQLVAEGGGIFVVTKQFGRVKVSWETLGGQTVWVTPTQQQAFEKFRDTAVRSPSENRLLIHKTAIYSVLFSKDGRTLVTGCEDKDSSIKLWDTATGALRGHLPISASTLELAFCSDGGVLASSHSGDGKVHLWDIAKREQITALSAGTSWKYWPSIQCLAVAPSISLLASDGAGNFVYVWDLKKQKLLHTLGGHSKRITALAFSRDGSTLAVASLGEGAGLYCPGVLKLWDPKEGREIVELKGHTGYIEALAFAANGKTLISAGYNENRDGEVLIWDVVNKSEKGTFKTVLNDVQELALSPDGRRIAIAGNDPRVRILDTMQAAEPREIKFQSGRVSSMAFSSDAETLAIGAADGTVRIREIPASK